MAVTPVIRDTSEKHWQRKRVRC